MTTGSSQARFRFSAGEVLRGKYRIKRVLGEGGMGVVVRATHLRLDQDVAIKMLRDARPPAHVVARFAREARAAARLKGDHAVRILDVDDDGDDDPFLVMEYLDGSDLDQIVRKHGPLTPSRAVDYALQVCEGLAEAHALGIVHRDVKPANVFLAKTPRGGEIVKILDFGISKAPEGKKDPTITEGERILGSPAFMSPEQLKSARDVDARSDVWSLGVVIYFLLSGRLPFEGDDATAVAARIASEDPKPLAIGSETESIPDALTAVVMRCLTKDRDARLASVAEVAHALAPFGTAGDVAAKRVSSVLRMPVAKADPASGSEPAAAAAGPAGPMTASLEMPIENALERPPLAAAAATASLDAPGPVSLGVIDANSTTASRDGGTAPAPSPSRRNAIGVAVLAIAGGLLWFVMRSHGGSPPPSSTSISSSSSPPLSAELPGNTAPTPSITTPAPNPPASIASAEASPSAPTASAKPAAVPVSAITTHVATPRDAGRAAPATSAAEDPLKLDIK